ncbi:MAG: branched-chain-amino-acid transaminase [Thermodesulfovibrionales bacterium]|nr:branched-chain-amino-acid transaminase [Thermodesulfovibrionales bacterium]
MYVFLNDKIVPASEAKISIFDHGFLYGDGVFETMRSYGGVVFKLDEHIQRLFRSARFINLEVGRTPEEIKKALYKTLNANDLTDSYIRVSLSRGYGPIGIDPDLCKENTFTIITTEFKRYPDSFYLEGVDAIISNIRRNPKEALNPLIKSMNFLNNILAKIEAKKKQAFEAIMLNMEGYIAEGTVSNIFFVKDSSLYTPSLECSILDGITRGVVIELAKKRGIGVQEGKYIAEELLKADEIFLTNTSLEMVPVKRVNDTEFKVGEIYKLLHEEYKVEVKTYVNEKKL